MILYPRVKNALASLLVVNRDPELDVHLFGRPPRPVSRLGLEPDQQGMRVLGLYVLEGSGMFEGV